MKKSRKNSLEKKLAAAASVVQLLNGLAPIVLPYVHVAQDASDVGGQAAPLSDVARALYGTAQATNYTVPDNDGATYVSIAGMGNNEIMSVKSGGTGEITTMNGGEQDLHGVGIIGTMNGGKQTVNGGGSGTVSTMNAPSIQSIWQGGRGVITTMNGGSQYIAGSDGSIGVMKDGTQTVNGDEAHGSIDVMDNGYQEIWNGGSGTIGVMNGGTQRIFYADANTGYVGVLHGGVQIIEEDGTGSVGRMEGGTVNVKGTFKGNLFGYGTVGTNLSLGSDQTVTASGGMLNVNGSLSANQVAVTGGGNLSVNNDLNASTISLSTTPTNTKPLVSAGGNITVDTVDFTGFSAKRGNVTQYNILQAGGSLSDLTVTRNGNSLAVKAGSSASSGVMRETMTPAQNLVLGCDAIHTVFHDGKALGYKLLPTYTDATFTGAIPWKTDSTYFDASEYAFNNTAAIDLAKLGFTFSDDAATTLAANQSMNLLSGLTGTPTITAAAPTSFPISLQRSNTTLSATATGAAAVAGGAVTYTLNGVTLDKVNVTNVSGRADTVPAGWTKNAAGVFVDTDSLNVAPDDLPSRSTILRADSDLFSDSNISGAYKYTNKATFNHTRRGVTISGAWSRGLRSSDDGKSLVFVSSELRADAVTFGQMEWGNYRKLPGVLKCDFSNATLDATNLFFTDLDSRINPGYWSFLLDGANYLPRNADVKGARHRQDFDTRTLNGAALSATLTGDIFITEGTVVYQADSITLNSVSLSDWDGRPSKVPDGWTKNSAGVTVDTDNMDPNPEDVAGRTVNILTGGIGLFTGAALTGSNVYTDNARAFSNTRNGVTLSGTWPRGVDVGAAGRSLIFRTGNVNVDAVALGAIPWENGASLRPNAGLVAAINYAKVAGVDTSNFSIVNPENAGAYETVTLLAANNTLKDMAAETKTAAYNYSPVSGVTVTGGLTGVLQAQDGNLTFRSTANRASNLSFGGVDWTGETPLMTRPEKISFNGATVDTSKIAFMNVSSLKKGDATILFTDFDGIPGTIVGDRYRIGTAFEGDGKASRSGSRLIFTVESAPEAAEQTHNALMGAGAGMVALSSGNDFIEGAAGGLGQASNTGSDGVSTYAQMGGGATRQETGSHIDVHGWNAILALGRKNAKEKSTFEYGAFFEYGNGNYTTHNGDLRGDGSVRYTGGGLLAKWTAKHGLYVEGSLRAGNIHGETNGVLRDVNGAPYGYDTDAPYWGLHLGVGRELDLGHDNTLDVYGKYFMNRRNGVDFNAGEGRYDLDALTSHILRVGARYTMKRDKWNFYGGLAYEHELDGKASGTVSNGVISAPIRGTDPTGGSVRMELGATMQPENSPWSLDLNVAGFAGKKQGITGGVSVSFMF